MAFYDVDNAMTVKLDYELPKVPAFREGIRRAPRREAHLSEADKALAIRNALRYIHPDHHLQMAREFARELEEHGRIYGYRFRPEGELHGKPIDQYKGSCIEAKAFQVMIDNNLDFDVALYPYELVTYGETGQVCQNWMQYRLIKKYLEVMTDEQTLVVMSGHPLGLFHSHKLAPRCIITNGLMVGTFDDQKNFNRAAALGVANYGQMTAGGWMYIGPQGIVHGTFNTLLNAGRLKLGIPADGHLAGRLFVSAGLGGMSGAQGKAAEIAGAVSIIAEVDDSRIETRYTQGGGILSTVRATRAASEGQLAHKAEAVLAEMLRMGVTTCEAKSGYGLESEQEYKQLRVIRRRNETQPVELAATFMGAHALPEEYRGRREDYIRLLCREMIPCAAREGLAEFCDVFCEEGVFTAQESRTILEAGLAHGLRPKVHADEIAAIGGSQLAGDIGAISAEHLIVCPPEGIRSLAAGGTVACCLPATSFYLGAAYAPAREMIRAGVPVAVATDFNPGSCPGSSLQLAMNIACLKYRMTPEEVLTAVTLNAAAAIGRAGTIGSVEPGKQADLLLWNAPDLDYVCYRFGSNLVGTVMKKGRIVHEE